MNLGSFQLFCFCALSDHPTQPLKAWLFRVFYHRCLDELRKKNRQPVISFSQLERESSKEEPLFAEMIPDGQPVPEEILEQ